MRPRVLYVISDLQSGMGKTALCCLERLGGEHEFQVCELRSHGSVNKDRARTIGVEVTELGKPGVNPSVLMDLLRVARRFRPDVIQGFELETNFYATLVGRLVGARVVASFHGLITAFRWRRAPALYVVLLGADRIACVARAVASRCLARAHWVERRMEVIRNGVRAGDGDLDAPRRSPDGPATVTYVGNFHSPVKGHAVLLRAVAMLEPEEARLWLVGGGRFLEEMQGLAEKLGAADRVTFWGFRDDVRALLQGSDLFVMPSLSEGCPHALLEAMAAGVPAIATRAGGIPEVIRDGESGLLVPPGDPAAICAAIRRLARDRDLRIRLRGAGAARVREAFDPEMQARRYGELYEALAGP